MALDIHPLAGHLGAEVHGMDLAHLDGPGDSGAFDDLQRAFLDHHVLVLRDQKLDPEQLTAFGRRWGPLLVHPIVPHIEGNPEVIEIRNLTKKYTITEVWHSDVTFVERPPAISMLHALEMPAAGGDTLFANQHVACERLSEGMRRLLGGLRAVHTGAGLGAAMGKGEDWRTHGRLHPVVRTHPETGREALYVNEAFTVAFEDMTPEESRPLLRFLWNRATLHDLTMRHAWRPGDLVMWDNRSVMHYAIHDHGNVTRTLHRITVEGDEPR